MHKLNEHAIFIYRGTLFLLFCKKSPKYQNNGLFKSHCTVNFVFVYSVTTSTANTETFLKITFTSLNW